MVVFCAYCGKPINPLNAPSIYRQRICENCFYIHTTATIKKEDPPEKKDV